MLELRNPDAPAVPGEATAWKRKDLLDTDTLSEAELHLIKTAVLTCQRHPFKVQ